MNNTGDFILGFLHLFLDAAGWLWDQPIWIGVPIFLFIVVLSCMAKKT